MRTCVCALVLLSVFSINNAWAGFARPLPGRGGEGGGEAEKKVAWNEAEYVFSAKLDDVQAGPVANSFPPIYNHTLKLTVEKSLRGTAKAGEKISAHNAAHQQNEPTFPVGKVCLVALKKTREGMSIIRIEESDEAKVADVERMCSLPLGWKIEKGRTISPWAKQGKKWPADVKLDAKITCAETGRPALLLGSGFKFEVEPIPPKKKLEFSNPDGDGEYKVTLTNTTDKEAVVPALLTDGKKILWEECLVILSQSKVYPCPGSHGIEGKIEPVKLKPGEQISTVVNTFQLDGPEWPQGGYRIEFQFCLGESSQTKSFYYYSKHHDPIRSAAQGSGK